METNHNPAEKKRTGTSGQKLTPGLIILVVVSFFALAYFGAMAWGLLVIVLAAIHFIRSRKNRVRLSPEEKAEVKECDLCGIRTENLVSLQRSNRSILVCEECYRANCSGKTEEPEKPVKEKPAEAETTPVSEKLNAQIVPATERLITETDQERESRLEVLAEKKKSGAPLREEFFLEDIEDERSIRKICELWESYGFGKEYPGIDASLARLREKESGAWYSTKAVSGLKEELRSLLHGMDV